MTAPSWWPTRMPWDPETDPVQHPDGRITLNVPPGPDGEVLRAEIARVQQALGARPWELLRSGEVSVPDRSTSPPDDPAQ